MPNVEQVFQSFAAGLELPRKDLQNALKKGEQVTEGLKRKLKVNSTFLGGSYRRGTDMPLDSLKLHLVLSPKYYFDCKENSTKLLSFLRNRLSDSYADSVISKSGMVVRMKNTPGIDLDLVPSVRLNQGGYLIPNGHGGWSKTNPNREETLFQDKDEHALGRFRKLVKIMKAWNFQNGRVFNSYYLELMVYYRVSDFNKSYTELVHSLFGSKRLFLPEFLNCPAVGEGISSGVLTGLGQKVVEEAYSLTSKMLHEKDEVAISTWKTLMGEAFGERKRPRVR